jgi:Fe-S-cluster containining protein
MKSIEQYWQLVHRLEEKLDATRRRWAEQIACGESCSECCETSFSVFMVESYAIRESIHRYPAEIRGRILKRCDDYLHRRVENGTCPFLEDDLCLIYTYRPIICRTHGFPILVKESNNGDGAFVDYCHRNFTALEETLSLDRESIIDLNNLNHSLAAINLLFILEKFGDIPNEPPRIPLALIPFFAFQTPLSDEVSR